jgi:DNA polymerase I
LKQADKAAAKEIIKLLLGQTKIGTMIEQYERLEPWIDGRIRTQQQVVGTETGRLNSRGQRPPEWWPEKLTNLQNLVNAKKYPKLNPLFNVRTCVVPDPGYVLLAADYGKAELFAYLAYAGDKERIAKLHAGVDLHAETAAAICGCSVEELTYEQRQVQGKFPNFSLGYGGGWQMFMGKVNKDSDLTGISVDAKTSKSTVNGWRRINPKTTRGWDTMKMEVAEKGYLVNAYGRKRIFLGKGGSGNDVIAQNPQSTIADHVNYSIVSLFEEHDPHDLLYQLQVHDEILAQAPIKSWMKAARIMKEKMSRPLVINGIEINIPVEVSVGFKNWGEMKAVELGD